jgi:hypothetical protein
MKWHLLLILSAAVASAQAAVRNFSFEGHLTLLRDFSFELDASITNGATVKGFYIYDDSAADASEDTTVGSFHYTNSVFGIAVSVGNYVFRTNPEHVDFLLSVVNRERDNYLLRSYHNVSSTGLRVNHISWQLDDPSGTALNSDAMPPEPPNLAAFPDTFFGLTIEGGFDSYLIRAVITKVSVTPPVIPEAPEVTIAEAVELTFPSAMGYLYQIEYSQNLDEWTKIGAPVLGDGKVITQFVPKLAQRRLYYRARITTSP